MKRIIEMSAESFAEMELDRNEMLYFKNGCWFLKANDDLVAWRDADGKYWLVVNPDMGLAAIRMAEAASTWSKKEAKEMDDKERYELMEELCARFRYIAKTYPDIDLKQCVVIGGNDIGDHVSNVRYVYCATMADYKLGNCANYKACRDFEEGWK